VIYRLLGNLKIGRDGKSLDLPGGHNLTVLAALLINSNQRLSKTELLKAAWGSAEVNEAQLHKAVAALRALLGRIGHDGDLVTYARHGYGIQVSDDDLDMLLFRRLVLQAEEARAQGRGDEEIGLLRRALGLWHGQHPLSNVPSDAFEQEITGLEQRRKRAAVRLFDLELAGGSYDSILDGLALIADYYPDDARLAEQLIVVQYRSGHVTDATAAYERFTAALADKTGGEPDPVLRELYYAIAQGDQRKVTAAESAIARRAGLTGAGAAAAAPPAIPRQLPPDPGDLVGRGDLIAEASWLLGRPPDRAVPVVVVSGPGASARPRWPCGSRTCRASAIRTASSIRNCAVRMGSRPPRARSWPSSCVPSACRPCRRERPSGSRRTARCWPAAGCWSCWTMLPTERRSATSSRPILPAGCW
jgi:DNA-binding SARP family transcriptional activator